MPTFSYLALNKSGKEIKGTMDGKQREDILTALKADGLIPISVSHASLLSREINLAFMEKKPKVRDLSVFCRQFTSIINAGVPVNNALEMLAEQTENKLLAKAIDDCRSGIQSGKSLSESMSEHPKVFPSLLITMAAAGEASGKLDISFERMAIHFEKEAKIKAMVKKATIYPAAIVIIATIVVILLLTFVIPQFEAMLEDLGTEMPTLTVIVMQASEFMQQFWYLVIIGLGLITYLIRLYIKTPAGKMNLGVIQLRLPLFKTLTTKTAAARMCRTMSTLLAAGISIIEAIEIAANTMDNVLFKNSLLEAKDDVAMGAPFSEPLTTGKMFPPMVKHMIKIGEEVGNLEGMMERTAEYYEEETETAIQSLMAAIEPAIIVVLALVVGVIVMAIMLPMTEMMTGLGAL